MSALFVCAHGAGGHMADAAMERAAGALGPAGFELVRFNFPYREKGARRPDPMPVLVQTIREVATRARVAGRRLILGGRSMGGRAASMLAAEGFACDGLLLLAYPLHPAGNPARLRAEHLARIPVPVLCVNGTRDALCTRALMDQALAAVRAPWTMHWLEGADHSFRVARSSGRSDAELDAELAAAAARWLAALPGKV